MMKIFVLELHMIHRYLWVQIIMPSRPIAGDHSGSGHLISRNVGSTLKVSLGAQGVQKQQTCYEFGSFIMKIFVLELYTKFNAVGKCSKSNCSFAYQCAVESTLSIPV